MLPAEYERPAAAPDVSMTACGPGVVGLLDHKHFGAVRPLTGGASFTLLPRDDDA
jgi:hypothetical protein